jgi:membrane protease YdiL (CAAX protease family)
MAFRFRPSTRALGRVAEVLTAAFAVIFVLSRLGVDIIFVYKSGIALALLLLIILERGDLIRIYIRESGLYEHLRPCLLMALGGVGVVAAGHFIYRGPSPTILSIPTELLVLVGIGWAILNSFSEEFIYRGVLLHRLEQVVSQPTAILLQAVAFSIAHFWTIIPLGIPGALLSFLFALALGWLVRRTHSLSAPIIVHFLVDLSLFVTVVLRQ